MYEDDIKLECPNQISSKQDLIIKWDIECDDVVCTINITNRNIGYTYNNLNPKGEITETRFKGMISDITVTIIVFDRNLGSSITKQKTVVVGNSKVIQENNKSIGKTKDNSNVVSHTNKIKPLHRHDNLKIFKAPLNEYGIRIECPDEIIIDQDLHIKWSVDRDDVECSINVTNGDINRTYNKQNLIGELTITCFKGISGNIIVSITIKRQKEEFTKQKIVVVKKQTTNTRKYMKKIHLERNRDKDTLDFIGLITFIQLIIGIICLIPPILIAISFMLKVLNLGKWIVSLNLLVISWIGDSNATPAALIYLGLMAIAGTFIVSSAVKNITFASKIFDATGDITDLEITEE